MSPLVLAAALALAPPGASACSGCHGPSAGPVPALDGRPAGELTEAMREFRNGERPATVMDRIAKGFSEAETRAIAEWLSRRPAPR